MDGISVFRDMVVTGPDDTRAAIADALAATTAAPWSFDAEASRNAQLDATDQAGVMIFQRAADRAYPAARLVLWPKERGYYVPNIIPATTSALSVSQYNAILADFADGVAKPIARRFGWNVGITAAVQNLEDWLAAEPAAALRRFSSAANKSTGASHPLDQRRWFDFIIAVHRNGGDIGTDRLSRWLHEVEGWDEETAESLSGEYERGMALLKRDAETR